MVGLTIALSRVVSEIFNKNTRCVPFFDIFNVKNAMTLKTGLGVSQGHWKFHHSIERIRLPIDVLWFYLVSFLRYSISKNVVTLKSGSKVTQGSSSRNIYTRRSKSNSQQCAAVSAEQLSLQQFLELADCRVGLTQ